jgi:hypothetical protein
VPKESSLTAAVIAGTAAAPVPAGAIGPMGEETVGLVQPYHARKRYLCPGCEGFIETGEGHLVVVPETAADLRRHWHRGCWYREQRRRRGAIG